MLDILAQLLVGVLIVCAMLLVVVRLRPKNNTDVHLIMLAIALFIVYASLMFVTIIQTTVGRQLSAGSVVEELRKQRKIHYVREAVDR